MEFEAEKLFELEILIEPAIELLCETLVISEALTLPRSDMLSDAEVLLLSLVAFLTTVITAAPVTVML
ncbi:hypothetical protein [Pediococcus claussenii]|uniref:hypothetical protein n=1 Tax=Pediococcus claussenii TaxID=187452 RepID=UPI0012E9DC10|nr:hypothetical protein [Pediococcus claussenii]